MPSEITIDSPVAEARAVQGMFDADKNSTSATGYFAICAKGAKARKRRRWHQTMHSIDVLDTAVGAIGTSPDAYISQARFALPARNASAFESLSAVWVDIDCHKLLGLEQEEFAGRVYERLEHVGLPMPTYTVGSGNGLHLKWILQEPIRPTRLGAWKSVQRTMSMILADLAADQGVGDVSRVLRVLHSTNSSAQDRGRQGRVDLVQHTGRTHTLTGLSRSLAEVDPTRVAGTVKAARQFLRRIRSMADTVQVSEMSTDFDALEQYAHSRQPLMRSDALTRLNWGRFIDLRDLAIRRGGFHVGQRDLFLFWMGVHLALSHVIRPGNFDQELRELVRAFPVDGDFNPIDDGSMETLRKRVLAASSFRSSSSNRRSPIYTVSNQRLIDMLRITDEEMRHLGTIISVQEAQRRKQRDPRIAQMRQAVESATREFGTQGRVNVSVLAKTAGVSRSRLYRDCEGAVGEFRATHERARRATIDRVVDLAGQGVGVRRIAREMGIPPSTVSRWLRDRAQGSANVVAHQPTTAQPGTDAAVVQAIHQEQKERLARWHAEVAVHRQADVDDVLDRFRQYLRARAPAQEQVDG